MESREVDIVVRDRPSRNTFLGFWKKKKTHHLIGAWENALGAKNAKENTLHIMVSIMHLHLLNSYYWLQIRVDVVKIENTFAKRYI